MGDKVLRRLPPWKINKDGSIKPGAFEPHPDDGKMSVFAADSNSTKTVLQACIDDRRALLGSEDIEIKQRAQNFLAKNGNSPDEFFQKGWRVCEFEVDRVPEEFSIGEPDPTGHRNISGLLEDFEANLASFVRIATIRPTLD